MLTNLFAPNKAPVDQQPLVPPLLQTPPPEMSEQLQHTASTSSISSDSPPSTVEYIDTLSAEGMKESPPAVKINEDVSENTQTIQNPQTIQNIQNIQNVQVKPNSVSEGEDEEYIMQMPGGWRGHWFFVCLAGWWCFNTLTTAAATSVVWPAQIKAIVNNSGKQDLYNGFIPSFGALVSLVITPIAGSLSDHSTHRWGRRKVYLIIAMSFLNQGTGFDSIWILMVLIMGFSFGQQWAAGPYAGLMPDLVPKRLYGLASGWLGLAIAVGDLIGALGAGLLIDKRNFVPAYMYLLALGIPFALLTFVFIKEIPRPPPQEPFSVRKLVREFHLDPKLYRDFYWVIVTRFFYDMGVYSILPFFQYYYSDIIKSSDRMAVILSSITVAVIVVVSIPASLIAGKLSDRVGRKIVVYFSTTIMAFGCSALIIISFHPSIAASLVMSGFVGIGFGAYQAVDWALALDVLPPGANVAKDMGIWHLSFVLPQVISPIITGALLQEVKKKSYQAAYASVFGMTVFWFVLATVFVYPVRARRQNQHNTPVHLKTSQLIHHE